MEAELIAVGGNLLVDRQSETGTFVNGRRVSECRLEQGDPISLGETLRRLIRLLNLRELL
jgi:pSer/pThr/pTyr-binding forkhead associated (FHA) protein